MTAALLAGSRIKAIASTMAGNTLPYFLPIRSSTAIHIGV